MLKNYSKISLYLSNLWTYISGIKQIVYQAKKSSIRSLFILILFKIDQIVCAWPNITVTYLELCKMNCSNILSLWNSNILQIYWLNWPQNWFFILKRISFFIFPFLSYPIQVRIINGSLLSLCPVNISPLSYKTWHRRCARIS